jgi:hypothetical protein
LDFGEDMIGVLFVFDGDFEHEVGIIAGEV